MIREWTVGVAGLLLMAALGAFSFMGAGSAHAAQPGVVNGVSPAPAVRPSPRPSVKPVQPAVRPVQPVRPAVNAPVASPRPAMPRPVVTPRPAPKLPERQPATPPAQVRDAPSTPAKEKAEKTARKPARKPVPPPDNTPIVSNTPVILQPPQTSWGPGGPVAAGAALGSLPPGLAVSVAGPPPANGMCWYYKTPDRKVGFWDKCS